MSDEPDSSADTSAASQNYENLKRILDHIAEAIAGEPADNEEQWLRGVQKAARALFDALEKHELVTEAEGGFLPDVTAEKPALMAERERLEREHHDMLQRAEEIEEEVDREFSFQEFNTEMVRLQASILHDILQLHLMRTDALLYEAYFRVEGGRQG